MRRLRASLIDLACVLGCWLSLYWLPVLLLPRSSTTSEAWITVLAAVAVVVVAAGRRLSSGTMVVCFALYAFYALIGFRTGSNWFYHDNPGELSPIVIAIVFVRSAAFTLPVLVGAVLARGWGALSAHRALSRRGSDAGRDST